MNNVASCDYDGGDCCGDSVVTTYCESCECLDPAFATTTEAPACKDNWKTKKCQKRKNKGKCNKNWVAKNCQLTCELCEGGSGEEQCQDNWSAAKCQKKLNQDKCERDWVAKNCLFTCGYCDDK